MNGRRLIFGNGKTRRFIAELLIGAMMMVILSPIAAFSEEEYPPYRTVTVRSGETLSSIAARELGSASRWTLIRDLNNLSNANMLSVGQQLRIPVDYSPVAQDWINRAVRRVNALSQGAERRTAEDTLVSARSAYQAGRYPEAIRLSRLAIQQAEGVRIPEGMSPGEALAAEVAGPVQKRPDSVTEWTTLRSRDSLATGAWVRTSNEGLVSFSVPGGGLSVGPSSALSFAELYQNPSRGNRISGIRLYLGTFKAASQETASEIRLYTPSASLSFSGLGTEIDLWVDEQKTTLFHVVSGQATVLAGGDERVFFSGQGGRIAAGGRLQSLDEIPVSVRLTAPTSGASLSSTVLFKWEDSQPQTVGEYLFQIASDPAFGNILLEQRVREKELEVTDIPDGRYYWRAAQVLPEGMTAPFTASSGFVVDSRPPQIAVSSPAGLVATSPEFITGRTVPNARVMHAGGEATAGPDGRFVLPIHSEPGINLFPLAVITADGRTAHDILFYMDGSRGVLSQGADNHIYSASSVLQVSGMIPMEAAVSVNGNELMVTEDGELVELVDLNEGVSSLDLSLNWGSIEFKKTVEIWRDATPPRITSITADPPALNPGETVTVTVTAVDEGSGLADYGTITMDGPSDFHYEGRMARVAPGTYRIMIVVPRDVRGGTLILRSVSVSDRGGNTETLTLEGDTLIRDSNGVVKLVLGGLAALGIGVLIGGL